MTLALTCGFAASGSAATVSFGPATTISGDSDVSTSGTLDRAFNFGASGVSTTTINGVAFTGLDNANNAASVTSGNTVIGSSGGGNTVNAFNSFGSGNAPFANLSAAYQSLLSTGYYNDNGNLSVTLNGLTIGQTYLFQTFVNDSRPCCGFRSESVTSGNSVTLNYGANSTDGAVGQFTIGTFTADSSSQLINYTIVAGGSLSSQVMGFQLRSVPVPEPTSLVLFGLGALGLMATFALRKS